MDHPGSRALTVGRFGGVALVLIGLGAYTATEFASLTALIPALFGAMIVGLAVVGRRPGRQDLSTLGIGLLALLVAPGSARGLRDVMTLAAGGAVDSVVATAAQVLSVAVSVVIVAVTVAYARS